MIFYLQLALGVILIIAMIYVILVFLLPPAMGAPYVPTNNAAVQVMVGLANIKPGERMVDLGSGDGRIVIAFAQRGIEAHGYEINPSLVFWSRLNIRRLGLHKKAFIHWRSFNRCDFSKFEIVTTYTLPRFMASLENRLQNTLPKNGRVVSHRFRFPNWQPSEVKDKVYLYKASQS